MVEWQPIETAPTGGVSVLVCENGEVTVAESWNDKEGRDFFALANGQNVQAEISQLNPTHWQPLPEPPHE